MDKVDQTIKDMAGKTYYESTFDAIKTVGAGNAAGLIGSAAALANAIEKQWSNAIWLKCLALCFALGVISSSYAYLSFYRIFRRLHSDLRKEEEFKRTGQAIPAREEGNTAKEFADRAGFASILSMCLFFIGMFVILAVLSLVPTGPKG